MQIVLRGHAAIRSLQRLAARPRGLRRQATTATAQAIPTTAALTSRHSGHTATRLLTTATATIRSRVLTIRRPHARTRRRELIPHRAAAIQLLHAPTPHPATAPAAGVVALVAAAAAAAEAPSLTVGTNLFANTKARPDVSGGPFVFQHQLQVKFYPPRIYRVSG